MAASNMDKIRQTTSGGRPVNTYLTAAKTVGSNTITVSTTTGWATDTGTDFVIFIKDPTTNKEVAGTRTTWVGVVSGSTINSMVLKAGTEPTGGYPSGENSVVLATPTATWSTDLAKAMANQHNVLDGSHGNITATGYSQTTGSFVVPTNAIQASALSTSAITLGYAETKANTGGYGGTPTAVPLLTVTVTIPSGGRKTRVTAELPFVQTSAASSQIIYIYNSSTVTGSPIQTALTYQGSGSSGTSLRTSWIGTPSAGSQTYIVAVANPGGTATVACDATHVGYILVEAI